MRTIIFTSVIFLSTQLVAQSRLDSLWNDPFIEKRITAGIEANRKGNFTINFPTSKSATSIEIKQLEHEFLFGANAFMINGFDSPEKNKRFEGLFSSLFNLACVPFYWKTLEPKQGQARFASNSEPIYRRPPPDAVLEFCKQYNIIPKGHTLVWNNPDHSVPDWMPKDTSKIEELIKNRIADIGSRYGDKIHTWDIVNESLHYFPKVIMPEDYVFKSFEKAKSSFPSNTKMMINEVTSIWQTNNREYSPYFLLISNLLQRGVKIDAIGMQFHFFNEQLHHDVVAGKAMTPQQLFDVLDLYGKFKKPLQVSEITIPSLPNTAEGQKNQATLTRNFYRLWFSHPSVEAIIWWNAVDGTAVKGEDKWNGGFVNNDFSPKPAYEVLNTLINQEWKTNISTSITNKNSFDFRGFYGEYLVTIKQGKKVMEQKITLSRTGQASVTIQ